MVVETADVPVIKMPKQMEVTCHKSTPAYANTFLADARDCRLMTLSALAMATAAN